MANPDAPFGLRPVRHLNGNEWGGGTIRCYITATYATALYVGDPVRLDGTNTDRVTTVRCPTVIQSTLLDAQYVFGVITSFVPDPDNLSLQYRAGLTARFCNVCVDPDVIYWIQDDGEAVLTEDTIGGNAVGINTHDGDGILTGLSTFELDAGGTDAPAEDATNPLFILGVADIEGNDFDCVADTRMIWEVIINKHQLRPVTNTGGGLGVLGA
jgi:hypothetical protein